MEGKESMNLETTRLGGRPRNRWQDKGWKTSWGIGWRERVHNRRTEEAPENGKESSHSAHGNE